LLIGKTGVGKSNLVKYLESNFECNIVIDANHLKSIDEAFIATKNKLSELDISRPINELEILYYVYKYSPFPRKQAVVEGSIYAFSILPLLYLSHFRATSVDIKEKMNESLKKYDIGFSIASVVVDRKFDVIFQKGSVRILKFTDLSSGEKTMFALLSCAICNELVKDEIGSYSNPKLLLFDEVDIHFHPEYTKSFYRIIDDYFNTNVYIVMTTHNPATISLSTDRFKVWNMSRNIHSGDTLISPIHTKRHAISILSDHLLNIAEDLNIVYVEDDKDSRFYNAVYRKFLASGLLASTGSKLVFIPSGVKFDTIRKAGNELNDCQKKLEKDLNDYQSRLPDDLFNMLSETLKKMRKIDIRTMTNHKNGSSGVISKVAINSPIQAKYDSKGVAIPKSSMPQSAEVIRPMSHFGLIDRDYEHLSRNRLFATNFHSLENYLLFPLNLADVLGRSLYKNYRNLKLDPSPRDILLCNIFTFISDWWKIVDEDTESEESRAKTQAVCDYILSCMSEKKLLDPSSFTIIEGDIAVKLANGWVLRVQQKYLVELQGHSLDMQVFDSLFTGYSICSRDSFDQQLFNSLNCIPAAILPKNLLELLESLTKSDEIKIDTTIRIIRDYFLSQKLNIVRAESVLIPVTLVSFGNMDAFCKLINSEFVVCYHSYEILFSSGISAEEFSKRMDPNFVEPKQLIQRKSLKPQHCLPNEKPKKSNDFILGRSTTASSSATTVPSERSQSTSNRVATTSNSTELNSILSPIAVNHVEVSPIVEDLKRQMSEEDANDLRSNPKLSAVNSNF
jgi:hypothetical protein